MSNRYKKRVPVSESIKPYIQFSKKIIRFCILNLIIIEVFVMYMIFVTKDTGVLPYLITSLAVQFLGCVVWYLKNSEAEKKSRIEAEMERMRLVSKNAASTVMEKVRGVTNPEVEPDTYYKGNEGDVAVNTDIIPTIIHSNNSVNNNSSCIEIEEDSDAVG